MGQRGIDGQRARRQADRLVVKRVHARGCSSERLADARKFAGPLRTRYT